MAKGKKFTGLPDAAAKLRASEKAKAEELIALRTAELEALEHQGKADGVLAQQLGEALYEYERGAYWSCIGQISDEGIAFARTLA